VKIFILNINFLSLGDKGDIKCEKVDFVAAGVSYLQPAEKPIARYWNTYKI
jgi:hypothetical protein